MIDPITDPRGAVAEFMRAAGQECPDQPVRLSPQLQELRRSLILEEIREFQQAADLYEKYGTNDALVSVADALADIAYVTIGAMVAWGFLAKNKRTGWPHCTRRRGDLWEAQSDRIWIDLCLHEALAKYAKAVDSHLKALDVWVSRTAIERYPNGQYGRPCSPAGILGALRSLMGCLYITAELYEIPLAKVFAEVHRSNMTKVIDGKCLLREDGKVMKPPGYSPPNVAAVLRQHGRIA